MPTTNSAKKRLRQSERKRVVNRSSKAELRTRVRKVRELAGQHKADDAAVTLQTTAKRLDQAAARGVIHPNKAARLKSRLSKLVKSSRETAAK